MLHLTQSKVQNQSTVQGQAQGQRAWGQSMTPFQL